MKPPLFPRGFRSLSAVAALAVLGLPLHAATVTWDNSSGTNAWSTAANWDTNVEPVAADDAVLPAGLAATLTLSAGENAKTLTIDDSYTLTGGGLTLASAGSIGVAAAKTAAINTAVTATGGVTKTGDGTLTLGATNAITGGFLVSAGTLRLAVANAVNLGNTITVNTGAVLEVANVASDRAVTWNNGATLAGSGTGASFTGTLTIDALAAAVTFATAAATDVLTIGNGANDLTGGTSATTINVSGPGAVRLAAASNFDGSWNVASGARLELAVAAALGDTPASGVTLAGGTLSARINSATTFTGQANVALTANSTLLSDRSGGGAAVTHTLGSLALGAHTLTVAPGTNATSGIAGIVVGNVTLTGDATFAINDAGATNGKLTMGSLLGGGVARTLAKTGAGDLVITGGATDLVAGSTFTADGGGNLDLLFDGLGSGSSVAVSDLKHPLGAAALSMNGGVLGLLADGDNTAGVQNFVLSSGFALAGNITLDPNRRSGTGNSNKVFDVPTLTLAAGTVLSMAGDNTHGVRVTGATTLQGNVTLQGTTLTSRDGRLTIDGAIGDGGAGYSVSVGGGTSALNLTLNVASTYGGGTVMTGSNVTLNAASALGTGGLAQSGGTLIVNTDGAISGAISLSGGTLRVNDLDALAGNAIALNGGTLDMRTNATGTFSTGALTLGGNATMNFARDSGSGAFTPTFGSIINVSGNRTLTVTNANSLTPNFASIALAGDLTLSHASPISVSVQAIAQDATPRRFIKAGSGTTTLSGTGSFTGGAEVVGGTLLLNDPGALGGNVLTVGDTSGTAAATVQLGVGPSLANDIVVRTGSSGAATLRTAAGGMTWAGGVSLQRAGTFEGTAGTTTFSGVLSGVGNMSKTGNGEVVLGNAANTFGNGTASSVNIAAGTLSVTADGALGNAANGVTIAASQTFRAAGTFFSARTITFGGAGAHIEVTNGNVITLNATLAGNVAFEKEGLGTLAFGPAVTSTRTAGTTINDGTLQLSGATSLGVASAVTLAGGTLDLRNDASANYAHPLTIGSGTNAVNVDRAVGGAAVSGTHALGTVALAAQTLNITGSNGFGLTVGATTTTGASTLNHDAPGGLTLASVGLGGTGGPHTFTQDGEGGDVFVAGALAETNTPIYNFAKRGSHTLHLGTGFTVRGTVTVADGTFDLNNLNVVLPATTFTIGGGALNTAASVITGTGSLTLAGALTYASNSAVLPANITGSLALGAATRTFTINDSLGAAVDLDIAGPISGGVGSGFTKAGTGTLRLSGAGNAFTGLAAVQAGALELGKSSGDAIGLGGLTIGATSTATVRLLAANQINDAAAVAITNTSAAARLDLAGFSETLGATTLTATTTSGALLTTGAGGTLVLASGLTLANNFSASNAATTPRRVLLTGTGTTTTATTSGTLDLGGATRSIAVTTTVIGANAANANAVIETAIVNGGINKTGSQVLYLTNPASTFAGGLNIAEGVVDVGAAGAAGTGAITFANTATAALRLSADGLTLANPLVISAAGAAEAQLSYTGPIYTGATLAGPVTLERNVTADVLTGLIDQSDGQLFGRLTISGSIDDGAGAFALTKKGNGVLRLTGTNTHGGGTIIEKGTVEISADTALGQAGVAVTIAGGTLHAEASLTTARPVVFTSAGNVRVDAPNVLELTGAITPGGFDMGFYGSGTTVLSGSGGGGAGGLIVGKYASNFADPGTGTPQIDFGHVLSVRGTVALPTGNIWLLNDGVLELGTGDFSRAVGTGAGQVRMETHIGAGFAAHGANRVVNLGGAGATLTVGDPVTKFLRGDTGFGFDGIGALVLGSSTATHTVTFQNPLEFNSGDPTNGRMIRVPNGPAAKEAIMTGNLSLSGSAGTTGVYLELIVDGGLDMTGTISGAITLAMFGTGHLTLTGANTFTGLTSIDGGGTLNVNADAAFGDAANAVSFFGSTLQASANITTSRAFEFSASEGAGMVIDTNGFNVTFDSGSSLTGDKLQKIGAGTLTIAGGQSYDTLTASAGTTVVDSALGTGGSTINAFAGAHVIIRTSQTLAELNIGPGSTVTFTSAIPAPGIGHAVPEPGSLALLLLGALGFSGRRRRGTAVR